MTTIVNNPTPQSNDNSTGLIFGIIIFIILGLVFFYYGLPAIRTIGTPQINIPAPQINVPDKIDVNVNPTE